MLSAFIGTLVLMGVLSEKIMSSTIGERNLWWYYRVAPNKETSKLCAGGRACAGAPRKGATRYLALLSTVLMLARTFIIPSKAVEFQVPSCAAELTKSAPRGAIRSP